MFGANTQSNTMNSNNRFNNVSINFAQPAENISQQQTNQQNPYQPLQSNSQQTYFQLNSVNKPMFSNDHQTHFDSNSKSQEPEWFNNPKKRAIPQTVIRRNVNENGELGKQLVPGTSSSTSLTTTSNSTSSNSGFENISFGSRKSTFLFNPKNNQNKNLEHNNILTDSNEAPPTVSLHDWQREDEFGVSSTLSSQLGNNSGSMFMDSSFSSVHNGSSLSSSLSPTNNLKKERVLSAFDSKPSTSIFTSQALSNPSAYESNSFNVNSSTNSNISEGAVLVFGYAESISNSIISHFAKFGNILEDFQVLRSPSGITASNLKTITQSIDKTSEMKKKYPIYTGDGWVKLTYDSTSSAMRALQENGTILGGSLVGCVPYSKTAVEKLASCNIEKNDDIGNFNINSTTNEISHKTPINRNTDNENTLNAQKNGVTNKQSTLYPSHRLDIKDGKSLFIHNANSNNHNFLRTLEMKMRHQEEVNLQQQQQQRAGVLHKVNDWLFGWKDL